MGLGWEGWGGAGCPELSSLQASCAGTTIFPRHKERPSEGGREPRGAVCNHSSNLALEPRMWGGGVEGISSPGDPPPPTRPGCQSCRRADLVLPGPVWAGCSFVLLPRGLEHHTACEAQVRAVLMPRQLLLLHKGSPFKGGSGWGCQRPDNKRHRGATKGSV